MSSNKCYSRVKLINNNLGSPYTIKTSIDIGTKKLFYIPRVRIKTSTKNLDKTFSVVHSV